VFPSRKSVGIVDLTPRLRHYRWTFFERAEKGDKARERNVGLVSDSVSGRSIRRVLLVGLCVILVGIPLLTAWTLMHSRAGYFGWNVDPDGTTVDSVSPGGPAAMAGIRPGDRLDYQSLSLLGRLNVVLNHSVNPGDPLTVRIMRGGRSQSVHMQAKAFPQSIVWLTGTLPEITGAIYLAIGLWIVLRRRNAMTWAFLVSGLSFAVPFVPSDDAHVRYWGELVSEMAGNISSIGLLIFAGRFPNDEPLLGPRALHRSAIGLGIVAVSLGLYVDFTILWGERPPPAGAVFADHTLVQTILTFAAIALLIARFAMTRGSDRLRVAPVLITLGFALVLGSAYALTQQYLTDPAIYEIESLLSAVSFIAFAGAVAYGALRSRIFGVEFIVSRALVYTGITVVVVAVFAVVDLIVARSLAQSRFALVIETAAAILAGLSLNAFHGRVEHFVETLFFRKRREAEKHLSRSAQALPHALSADLVDTILVAEPTHWFELTSTAVFRRDPDGTFRRRNSVGWATEHCACLESTDPLLLLLRAELRPVALSDVHETASMPTGLAQPLVAIPVSVRHELEAVTFYGGHTGGEALDPDEVKSLTALSAAAGISYDHIRAEEMRKQVEDLHRQNAALGAERETISKMNEWLASRLAATEAQLAAMTKPAG
jgi:hypothetical protein